MSKQLPPIVRFMAQYHFLSNFYMHEVWYKGVTYPSAEHAYQCAKAITPADHDLILSAKTPGYAKRVAREVILIGNWEDTKVDTMLNILRAKFTPWMPLGTMRNPLSIRLQLTGDAELIEGNTWGDAFWGQSPIGNGENMLGKLLMKVRSEISHAR